MTFLIFKGIGIFLSLKDIVWDKLETGGLCPAALSALTYMAIWSTTISTLTASCSLPITILIQHPPNKPRKATYRDQD